MLKHLKLNQCTHIARPKPSGAMYISQRAIQKSFWFRFFQKANGVKRGRAPEKTALFFLRSFFFCAYATKRKSESVIFHIVVNQRTMYAQIYFTCHPERSEAESNFFVLDPKRHCVPFAPHCVRSSTALRMTQTKKCRAKQGRIYKEVAYLVRLIFFVFFSKENPRRGFSLICG